MASAKVKAKTTTEVLSTKQLNRALLARQLLLERSRLDVLAAIEQVGVLQAQWPKPPFVALWSRLAKFRPTDLTKLALARSVIRGTLHRGTLHLTSARDYRFARPALQPALTRGMRSILKQRLTDGSIDEKAILGDARRFFAAKPRTFGELRDHLIKEHPRSEERAMGYLARMELPLVLVPDASTWGWPTDATFALADGWLAPEKLADADEGLRHLVRRYLAAFGPASVRDVQSFTGLSPLAKTIAALRPELLVLHDEAGTELFDLPDAPRPDEAIAAPPRLLADYDSVLLAHHDRARIVPPAYRSKVILPGLRIPATFTVDGFVAGVWSIPKGKKPSAITLEPFGKLSKRTRETLEAEGAALLTFLAQALG